MTVCTCMCPCVCSVLHMNIISVITRASNEHPRTQTHTHMYILINSDLFVCFHVRFMTWLRRRLAGADNFSAWSKWARDCSQDGILFGRCCHQWQRLWLCRDCLFNLYCLNSFCFKDGRRGADVGCKAWLLHSKPEVWLGQHANGSGTSPLGRATRAEAFAVPFGISLTFHLSDERLKHVQNTYACSCSSST